MFYGKALFKRATFLVFMLAAVLLLIVADHLLRVTKAKRERTSKDPGQNILFISEVNDMIRKSRNESTSNGLQRTGPTMGGSVVGVKELDHKWLQHSAFNNASKSVECRDALCTNHLSRIDMNSFLQCQRNATKKVRRLAHRRNEGGTPSPLLTTMHMDDSTGALSSGQCRFMDGKGKAQSYSL
jgi:hypothetical protein